MPKPTAQAAGAVRRPFLFALLGVAALALLVRAEAFVVSAEGTAPPPNRLGGAARPLAFLSTDKPIYRPGETVYLRAVVLRADTFFPWREHITGSVAIKGPQDDDVAVLPTIFSNSVVATGWTIPPGTPGGRYKARAAVGEDQSAPAERVFEVRAYHPPRLRTQIEFLHEGYGPGDTVLAVVNAARAEGGAPAGAKVTAVARVDGSEVARVEGLEIDAEGNARATFALPEAIETGEGTLAFLIEDGGVIETASKTIPILLQTLDIAFYPEGGELARGLESRVYIQARRPDGKPADVEGDLVPLDAEGKPDPAAEYTPFLIRTEHEGRGLFAFTPSDSEPRWGLRIHKPSGIDRIFPLPEAKADGVALRADKPVYDFEDKIGLTVSHRAAALPYRVTLHHREKLLSETRAERPENAAEAPGPLAARHELDPGDAEGVLIATVWDSSGRPVAERLVFRRPKFQVAIVVKAVNARTEGAPFTPGGRVRLEMEAADENGRPVEAVIGVAVVNDSVLEMVETRDQAPSLPVMVYLENEVKDLADAQVYFDAARPDAARDLDLLLGTQGWRRFILVRLDDLLRTDPDAAKRALAYYEPQRILMPYIPLGAAAAPGLIMNELAMADAAAWVDAVEAVRERPEAERAIIAFGDALQAAAPMPAAANAPADGAINQFAPPPEPDANMPLNPIGSPPVLAIGLEAGAGAAADPLAPNGEPLRADIRPGTPEPPGAPDRAEAPGLRPMMAPAAPLAGGGRMMLARAPRRLEALPTPIVVIREYAHAARPGRRPNDRVDFAETLYWNAGIRTNPRDGKASVEFDLSDSVTSFRVSADAFGNNGALGAGSALIESVEPFYIEPKLPPAIVSGDAIDMPLAVVNATGGELSSARLVLRAEGFSPAAREAQTGALAAGERGRAVFRLASDSPGVHSIAITAAADGYADAVTRVLEVLPRGFPAQAAASGLLSAESPFQRTFRIAADMLPGTMKTSIKAYPTPLANMEEALSALLRQPHGCFEQASSTNYPLVMAQTYFTTHAGVSPDKIRRGQELLAEGYRRLTGFESKERGYEWFGGDPGHEALTAYGLMQFHAMSQVADVDGAMVARTREWLMSRRDGEGGFLRNERALDTFGRAPAPLTNLYILWTLLESGGDAGRLADEIGHARRVAADTRDPYLLALAANILFLAKDEPAGRAIAQRLRDMAGPDGALDGAETSITRSGGDSLKIETTSLAVLAWLRLGPENAGAVENAMRWLFEGCKAGKFGSTQSTILALKAINAYSAARAVPKAPGAIQLRVNGRDFGQPAAFGPDTRGAIELPDCSAALGSGEHTIELVMMDGGEMPFALEITYHTLQPDNAPDCLLRLSTSLSAAEIGEGEPMDLRVELTVGDQDAAMPLAIIGMPGGLEPRHENLRELAAAGRISSYEIIGRELVLYWRALRAGETVRLDLPMVAETPGTYTAPASRAYLYYTDELKWWAPGETVAILAK